RRQWVLNLVYRFVGDREEAEDLAQEAFVRLRRQWVLNLVYRFVGDREEAEDLAQEAFVRLHRARRRYRPTARFSTFLYRLVTNLCLNETRRRQRRPTVVLEAADEVAADDSPAKTATRRELAAQVQTALRRLPRRGVRDAVDSASPVGPELGLPVRGRPRGGGGSGAGGVRAAAPGPAPLSAHGSVLHLPVPAGDQPVPQ
ncbi:MAG: sigma-70 family RNA polymerase sigma factor, partial [Armatimonadetes bacterium]|nr:sigma-70 family RNA polymerase sigma factor [Armatimonadota bacterium]